MKKDGTLIFQMAKRSLLSGVNYSAKVHFQNEIYVCRYMYM